MEIVISFNSEYLIPATVMLCSLFENNKEEQIRLHVLLGENGKQCISCIEDIIKQYGQEVVFYNMKDHPLPDLPVGLKSQNQHITIETYYRLFIAEILSTEIEKVLYLDADLIVCKSITELWNWNISDVAVAAITTSMDTKFHPATRLGYDVHKGYFNAGVLLINLRYWREHQLTNQFINYVAENIDNKEKFKYHDQDILNYVLQDAKIEIPVWYNYATELMYKDCYCSKNAPKSVIQKAFDNPVIIHYTGPDKPWYRGCHHPLRNYYYKYQQMTVWRDTPLKQRNNESKHTRFMHLLVCIKRREKSFYASNFDDYYRRTR